MRRDSLFVSLQVCKSYIEGLELCPSIFVYIVVIGKYIFEILLQFLKILFKRCKPLCNRMRCNHLPNSDKSPHYVDIHLNGNITIQ